MSLDWYVPITIAAFPVLDWFFRWLKRFDQNCWEGDFLPRGWIVWGWVCYGQPKDEFPSDVPRVGSFGVRDWRYILIRLPSIEWMQDHWLGDRYCWMQRCLFYFQPRGWGMTFMRLSDG